MVLTDSRKQAFYTKSTIIKQRRNDMADNTSNRGFASMDEDKQRDIASQGGKASSSKQDMSKLGKKGAKAQPTEAKAKGGHNSHKND